MTRLPADVRAKIRKAIALFRSDYGYDAAMSILYDLAAPITDKQWAEIARLANAGTDNQDNDRV